MSSLHPVEPNRRARFPRFLLVGSLAIALTTSQFLLPASAAADTTPPVITVASTIPTTVNLNHGPVTVTVDLKITDATGTVKPDVSAWTSPSRQNIASTSVTLRSGTTRNGIWRITLPFAPGMAAGTWDLWRDAAQDTLGNLYPRGPFRIGTINVVSSVPEMNTVPSVLATTVTPASHNLATGPARIVARVHLKDSTGARGSLTWLENPAGLQVGGQVRMRLYDGTAKNGWWTSTLTIPRTAPTGVWKVRATNPANIFGYDGTPPIGIPRYPVLGSVKVTRVALKTLSATPVPKISGTAKVGKKLTAVPGSWKPAPVALKYQWLRNGKAITKATKSSYTAVAADQGKKISIKVTGTKRGYTTVSKTSAKTKAVAKGTLATVKPKITGTAKVGKKLTAVSGKWKPIPVTQKYQWLRSGKAISKATKSKYVLVSADKGKKISIKVTGSKRGYTTVSKTSAATKAVARR